MYIIKYSNQIMGWVLHSESDNIKAYEIAGLIIFSAQDLIRLIIIGSQNI